MLPIEEKVEKQMISSPTIIRTVTSIYPAFFFFLTITRINVCDSGGGRSTMHTKPPTLLLHIDSQIGRCKERPRIPALDDTHHKARLVAWISSSMVVSYDAISQAWEHLH